MIRSVKFGGSSLSSAEDFLKVKNIVLSKKYSVVTVSASGKGKEYKTKLTDDLICCFCEKNGTLLNNIKSRLCNLIEKTRADRELFREVEQLDFNLQREKFISRGEYFSAKILAYLTGGSFLDAADFLTFDYSGQINLTQTKCKFNQKYNGTLTVIPGFYGAYPNGEVKLFDRGGGDTTGAVVSWLVGADLYENRTDVNGIYTADPHFFKSARLIEKMSFEQLKKLSHFGAKVIADQAADFCSLYGIPVLLCSSQSESAVGTFVTTLLEKTNSGYAVAYKGGYKAMSLKCTSEQNMNNICSLAHSLAKKYRLKIEHVCVGGDGAVCLCSGSQILSENTDEGVEIDDGIFKVGIVCFDDRLTVVAKVTQALYNAKITPVFFDAGNGDTFCFGVRENVFNDVISCIISL